MSINVVDNIKIAEKIIHIELLTFLSKDTPGTVDIFVDFSL